MARRGPLTRGREGKCVSVGGYEDGGKARFCLEVQERKLIQFKGPHNSLPAGADLAAAVRYVEESRLKVNGRNLSGNVEEAGEQAQAAGEGGCRENCPSEACAPTGGKCRASEESGGRWVAR